MKISIIGAGQVGGTTGLMVAQANLGDVVLVDVVEGLAAGKALDIMQSAPIQGFNGKVSGTSDYAEIADSELVIVTAGMARRPGMNRMDLLKRNFWIVKSVVAEIVEYAPGSLILMVTNPLDVMCWVALKLSGFACGRIFGMGGVLDTARFRYFVAKELRASYADVEAVVLGSHGDFMVPLLRYVRVSGRALRELLGPDEIERVVTCAKKAGAEIVGHLKSGSAYYAPAASIVEMVKAIVRDEHRILPVSAYLQGEYGAEDVYVGVPVRLGRVGVEEIIELELDVPEQEALYKSIENVKGGMEAIRDLI